MLVCACCQGQEVRDLRHAKSFTNGRFTTKPGDDVRLQYKQETGEEERWRDKDGRVQEALRGEMEESYSVITRLCARE